MPPAGADPKLVEKVVIANRILARYGIVDGFGHVSVRDPRGGFLLSRSLAPASTSHAPISCVSISISNLRRTAISASLT